LNNLGALSASEQRRLATAFWVGADDPPALPTGVWGPATPWLALSLPDPRGIVATDIVRQHILSHRLGELHGGMVFPEGYFRLVRYTIKPPEGGTEDSPHRRYVHWSSGDIGKLLDIIKTWWASHGQSTAEAITQAGWRMVFDGDSAHRFFNELLDVLRIVIIPRMSRRKSSVSALATLIADMRSAGLPIGSVLPATLILRPDSLNEVVALLRQEFANPKREYYLSALRGIVYWVHFGTSRGKSNRTLLPDMPPDLLREISMAVALRRPESLTMSLDCAYNVVRRLQTNSDAQFVRNLLIGLDYLFVETQYRETASEDGRYRYEEVPAFANWRLAWRGVWLTAGTEQTRSSGSGSMRQPPIPCLRFAESSPSPTHTWMSSRCLGRNRRPITFTDDKRVFHRRSSRPASLGFSSFSRAFSLFFSHELVTA